MVVCFFLPHSPSPLSHKTLQTSLRTSLIPSLLIPSLSITSLPFVHPGDVEEDADQDVRVITGGADELLRGYRLNTHIHTQSGDVKDAERKTLLGDDETVFEYFGAIKRTAVLAQQGSIEKCSALRINSAGTLLAAQSTGKVVEVGDSLRSAVLHCAVLFVMHSALLSFCDSSSAPFSPLFSFPLHLTSIRPLTG